MLHLLGDRRNFSTPKAQITASPQSSDTRLDPHNIDYAKLLQKSEMRKDIVIELSYKGFS